MLAKSTLLLQKQTKPAKEQDIEGSEGPRTLTLHCLSKPLFEKAWWLAPPLICSLGFAMFRAQGSVER